jgi:hypothetical protein
MSIQNNPCVRIAMRELERHGIRNVEIARGSKHPLLKFRVNGGPEKIFAVSGTSGDQMAPEATRRDLRVLLRHCGVEVSPTAKPPPPPRQPSRMELLERRIAALERAVMELKST